MSLVDIDSQWAEAHTLHFDAAVYIRSAKTSWMERMSKAPHGSLLKENSFFRSINKYDKKSKMSIYALEANNDKL